MATSPDELSSIEDAATTNAVRGVKGITIGDRRIDYQNSIDMIKAKRTIAEEDNGGMYDIAFAPKNYF